MYHKHKDLIDIWSSHTELVVEVKIKNTWYVCARSNLWKEDFNYRFYRPSDCSGKPIKVNRFYMHNKIEWQILDIDQVKAEIWLFNEDEKLEKVIHFWESSELKEMDSDHSKKIDLSLERIIIGRFHLFPDVEFVEVEDEGDYPGFVGYGYEWNNHVWISPLPSLPVSHSSATFQFAIKTMRDNTILQPQWRCFRKGE